MSYIVDRTSFDDCVNVLREEGDDEGGVLIIILLLPLLV